MSAEGSCRAIWPTRGSRGVPATRGLLATAGPTPRPSPIGQPRPPTTPRQHHPGSGGLDPGTGAPLSGCRPPPAAGAVEELPGLGCNRPWWPLPLLPLTATNRDASMEQVFFGIGNFFDVKVTKFPPHVHPVFAKMYSVHCTSPTRTADVFPATPNC